MILGKPDIVKLVLDGVCGCGCDTREAWCRKMSQRSSVCGVRVCVILGTPGAGELALDCM